MHTELGYSVAHPATQELLFLRTPWYLCVFLPRHLPFLLFLTAPLYILLKVYVSLPSTYHNLLFLSAVNNPTSIRAELAGRKSPSHIQQTTGTRRLDAGKNIVHTAGCPCRRMEMFDYLEIAEGHPGIVDGPHEPSVTSEGTTANISGSPA